MTLDLRALPAAATTVVVLLATFLLGVVGAPAVPGVGAAGAAGDATTTAPVAPTAGGAVCVTGASMRAPDADVLLVAPPAAPVAADGADGADETTDDATEDATDDGGVRSRGLVLGLEAPDGGSPRRAVGPVAPGTLVPVPVSPGADGWSWIGWADHPLLAWQAWRTDSGPGEPRGAVASACRPADAPVQTVVGLRTTGGERALLRLANPFLADATFAVTLVTPTGPVEPIQLRNVSVPAGRRVTVVLNDHVPEQEDVAAIVTVGAGRLAVEGRQSAIAELGGVEGVATAAPLTGPQVTWTLPWLPTGEGVDGAVWILNPAPRPVTVELTVHTADGPTVPVGVEAVDVGPGALERIPTADLVTDGTDAVGVTVRSTTSGVLVAGGARYRADDIARTGLVHVTASPAPDVRWAVAGVGAPGRTTVLHVVNRAASEVTPQVLLTTRPTDPDAGATQVRVAAPTIAPDAVGRIVLPLAGAATWSAVVEGGPGLVVARTTMGEEVREPVALAATPADAWGAVPPVEGGRERVGWVASLRTPAAAPPVVPGVVPAEP